MAEYINKERVFALLTEAARIHKDDSAKAMLTFFNLLNKAPADDVIPINGDAVAPPKSEYVKAWRDLAKAFNLSTINDDGSMLTYEINGTANAIPIAVYALVAQRQRRATL